MPSKNIVKQYSEDSYYHVYNRGVNKQAIFHDAQDYSVFLNLFKRYLDVTIQKDSKGREYEWLHNDIKLLAFCLMPNHFHLLLLQIDSSAMTKLLRCVCGAYTVYFNRKYNRVGPLFQGKYKASLIINEPYLMHISRYIHLNPKDYKVWEYSSYRYYKGKAKATWLSSDSILGMFNYDPNEYTEFMQDYEGHKLALDEIKSELATD